MKGVSGKVIFTIMALLAGSGRCLGAPAENRLGAERNIAGVEMVWIPAGEFMMGSPENEEGRDSDEGPVHKVTFRKGFWMGKYAVTQKLWKSVMSSNPSAFNPKNTISRTLIMQAGDANPHALGEQDKSPVTSEMEVVFSMLPLHATVSPQHIHPTTFSGQKVGRLPVERISWHEIQDFIKKLNLQTGKAFRLPSEAKWEYAARAGTKSPFSFDSPITVEKANYNGNDSNQGSPKGEYREETIPVDALKPNLWGLYQMHGNVWEWVQDCWHRNYQDAPADGSVWRVSKCDAYVLRGGSWQDSPEDLRSAKRLKFRPEFSSSNFGFRLVHD